MPGADLLHLGHDAGELGDEVTGPPHRERVLARQVVIARSAPHHLELSHRPQRIVRAEEHHERLDAMIGIVARLRP